MCFRLQLYGMNIKTLPKQEGQNVSWNACSLNPFFEFESAACCKKRFKNSIPTNVWHLLFCQGFSHATFSVFYETANRSLLTSFLIWGRPYQRR